MAVAHSSCYELLGYDYTVPSPTHSCPCPQGGETGYRVTVAAAIPQLNMLDDVPLQSEGGLCPSSPPRLQWSELDTDLNVVHSSLRLRPQRSEEGMVAVWGVLHVHCITVAFVGTACTALPPARPKTAPAQSKKFPGLIIRVLKFNLWFAGGVVPLLHDSTSELTHGEQCSTIQAPSVPNVQCRISLVCGV